MKPKENDDRDQAYAAWVGFDWGDQESGLCNGPTPESGSEGGWSKHQKHWTFGSVN